MNAETKAPAPAPAPATVAPELLTLGDFVRLREDSPRFEFIGKFWSDNCETVYMFKREGYDGETLVAWTPSKGKLIAA